MVGGGRWVVGVWWAKVVCLTKHALALLAEEGYDEPFRWVKLLHASMFQSSVPR